MIDTKKKKIGEEMEKLDWTGTENEHKGANAIKEVGKEQEKKQKEDTARQLEMLDSIVKNNARYREKLIYFIHDGLSALTWPDNWQWGVWFDGKGICVVIEDECKNRKKRAFKPSYITKYDHNAALRTVVWADDAIALFENTTNNSPIWIPRKN